MSSEKSLRSPPNEVIYEDDNFSLSIRPLEEKNAEDIFKAVHESMSNLLPFMDWAHNETSISGQLERIKRSRTDYFQGREYELAVFDHKTGGFLMSACWHKGKNRNNKSLEIGYWTRLKHCNKGLATLVTKILVIVGFDFMKSDRIEIGCNKHNIPSHEVIKKCGFTFEGEIRNYFKEPTIEMVRNGYSTERTYLQYVLLPGDREKLSWYPTIKQKIWTS